MKVSIKDLYVSMDLGNNGIELDVYDGKDTHLGDLIISKSGVVWCKGRTIKKNGVKVSWENLIEFFES